MIILREVSEVKNGAADLFRMTGFFLFVFHVISPKIPPAFQFAEITISSVQHSSLVVIIYLTKGCFRTFRKQKSGEIKNWIKIPLDLFLIRVAADWD